MIELQWIDERAELTLIELCRFCQIEVEQVTMWVVEGMLEPAGEGPEQWRFDGRSLQRARIAARLWRDLHIDPAGVALALDLMDEIARLRARVLGGEASPVHGRLAAHQARSRSPRASRTQR